MECYGNKGHINRYFNYGVITVNSLVAAELEFFHCNMFCVASIFGPNILRAAWVQHGFLFHRMPRYLHQFATSPAAGDNLDFVSDTVYLSDFSVLQPWLNVGVLALSRSVIRVSLSISEDSTYFVFSASRWNWPALSLVYSLDANNIILLNSVTFQMPNITYWFG